MGDWKLSILLICIFFSHVHTQCDIWNENSLAQVCPYIASGGICNDNANVSGIDTGSPDYLLEIPTRTADQPFLTGCFGIRRVWDTSAGFIASFSFNVGPPYGTNADTGYGFMFALQSQNFTDCTPEDGTGNLGLLSQTKGFGIGFDYTNTLTPFLRSYVSSDNIAFDPKINVTCPFSSVDTSTHSVQVIYSYQYSPALFQIYLDNSLVYSSQNVSLQNLLGGNSAYFGFRGAFSSTGKQTNRITNGVFPEDGTSLSLQTYTGDQTRYLNLLCPIINFYNASGTIEPYITNKPAFMNDNRRVTGRNPGNSFVFSASSRGLESGCLIAPRVQYIATTYPLNIATSVKCTSAVPTPDGNGLLWSEQGYDDSSWPAGVSLGTNAMDGPFRHSPIYPPSAVRYWTGDGATTVYCRMTFPRYCNIALGDRRFCYNFETCNSGLCTCELPYTGSNCTDYAVPTITSFSPRALPLGTGTITITGTNFYTGARVTIGGTTASLIVVSPTSAHFNLPSQTSAQVLSLYIQNLDNSTLSRSSNYSYVVYDSFTVTDVTPTTVSTEGDAIVYIYGTNFASFVEYRVLFDTEEVVANYLNSTRLWVYSPKHAAGIYQLKVTADSVNYLTINKDFQFQNDIVSPYCRNKEDSVEFPFYTLPVGYIHYPVNVVKYATATVQIAGTTVNDLSPYVFQGTDYISELTDGDYCCKPTLTNDAYRCGVFFKNNTSFNVSLPLVSKSRVNEIVTTWADPCNTMPASYNIYIKTGSSFELFTSRATGGKTPCVTIPGDRYTVGVCIDYFPNGFTQDITEILVEVDAGQQSVNGSFLYEAAVFGVVLTDPYFVNFALPQTSVTANATITFSNLNVTFATVDNNVATRTNVTVTLGLSYVYPNGTTIDKSNLILSSTSQIYTPSAFQNVKIMGSVPGTYALSVGGPSLQSSTHTFIINPSTPTKMVVQPTSLTITADKLVNFPSSIGVAILDSFDNLVQIPVYVNLSLPSDFQLETVPQPIATVNGVVNFTNLVAYKPYAQTYDLYVTAPGIPSVKVQVIVNPGYPTSLQYEGDVTSNNQEMISGSIRIHDGAGNIISNAYTGTVYISSISPNDYDVSSLQSSNVTIEDGQADLFFFFVGVYGNTYTVTFSMEPAYLPPVKVNISILTCESLDPNSQIIPLPGYQCMCNEGYELLNSTYNSTISRCEQCGINMYKKRAGNDACQKCPSGQDTFNQKGSSDCVCDIYHYYDGTSCVACPDGGVCGNNTVLGNDVGYWSSGKSKVFYPCYKSNAPSNDDLAASDEACPQGLLGENGTPCGVGYTGIRCLECQHGYGTSGPYCRECPSDSLNYFVLSACLLIAIILLSFMVIQGRNAKNKESVSVKILLNHIQMLGLLSAIGAVWSQPFLGLLIVGGTAAIIDQRIVNWDCAIDVSYYTKYVFFMIFPWLTIGFTAFIYSLVYLIRIYIMPKFKEYTEDYLYAKKRNIVAQWILSVIVITFITYPSVSIKVLEIFDCSIEVDGKTYLTAYPEQQCGTSSHAPYVVWSAIMLVVYCIGAPLLAFLSLAKYRSSESAHIQMILRFFYDGFKPNRYYWEIIIVLRKFLLVMFIIIFRDNLLHQIYGMTFVLQASLILHILLHPYTSGRQYRLELWSLTAILITLFLSLYIIEGINKGVAAIALSACVLVVHIFVVLAFFFFIARGIMRRFMTRTWAAIRGYWKSKAPEKLHRDTPKISKVSSFFQAFGEASENDREKLYASLQIWWKSSPNYKRRRLLNALIALSEGTAYENFRERAEDDSHNIELHQIK